MSGNMIASIVAVAMALVLAISGLRSQQLSRKKQLAMAGVWIAIILAVVLAIDWLGLVPAR
jgi:uncharacterized membrane protein YkvI